MPDFVCKYDAQEFMAESTTVSQAPNTVIEGVCIVSNPVLIQESTTEHIVPITNVLNHRMRKDL